MDLIIYYSGHAKCLANHKFGPAIRPHFLVHFILSGKGRYKVISGEKGAHDWMTVEQGQGFFNSSW